MKTIYNIKLSDHYSKSDRKHVISHFYGTGIITTRSYNIVPYGTIWTHYTSYLGKMVIDNYLNGGNYEEK